MRIAVVTPIPTPYRDPFWAEVASRPGVELDVFYCAAGKADRPWENDWSHGFRAEVLPGVNLLRWRGASASCYWNRAIVKRLRGGRYDAVVVGGYNHPTMLSAVRWCRRNRTPYYLMCESYRRSSKGMKGFVKDRLVGSIVSNAAGGFPTGTLAERYLVSYGARPESLARIPNVPDIAAFEAAGNRHEEAASLRLECGIGDRPVVLFVGRLIPKKRADLALRAFASTASGHDATFVIVGDGPERSALEQEAERLGIRGRILLRGFVPPTEIPTWQSIASLFVLPSSETWGVAVIEAVASGTPVIVSDEVGCHVDLVVDDRIGTVVPARNEQATADAIRDRLSRTDGRPRTLEAWSTIRDDFAYDKLADRFLNLINQADVRDPEIAVRERVAGP